MYWDVTVVKAKPEYKIYAETEDGILFAAVTWPNEQDIAPETLVNEMLPIETESNK